jgi:hypothetical protein
MGAARIGHRVVLEPRDDVSPPGLWRVIDRGPTAGHWWVKPADDAARTFLSTAVPWPVIQGCLEWPGRLMSGLQLELDLGG